MTTIARATKPCRAGSNDFRSPTGPETMRPPFDPRLLMGVMLLAFPASIAGQETKSSSGSEGVTAAPPASASVDPRFRSPRATARTFLIAMNAAEEDPHRIEDAIACLDLSGMPPDRRNGGRFAFEL